MINSSKHLWTELGKTKKDYIDEVWQNLIPPLMNEFYHPFYHINSYQILDDLLFKKNKGTIFLKDGVFSLLHFVARIYKNPDLICENFALPKHMAPIVPFELRPYFVFYDYNDIPIHPKDKGLLFVSPLRLYTDLKLLETQLKAAKNQLSELLIVRPILREDSLLIINGDHFDIDYYNKCLSCIIEQFPKKQIITSDKVFRLDLSHYHYLNTNHYRFFCSEDFFSYYFYFTSGQAHSSYLPLNSSTFEMIKTLPLIKNLSANFYRYHGPSLIDNDDIQVLKNLTTTERIFIDPNNETPPIQIYDSELFELSKTIANRLFNLSTRAFS